MNKQDAIKQLAALEVEVKKLKDIINRPEKTKEERFWELILQTSAIKIDKEAYPDSTFGFVNNTFLWEYNSKCKVLYLSYSSICSILEKEFDLNYNEIQQLIKEQVEEHFKVKGVTPIEYVGNDKV